jgi:hypothetical protein
MIVGASLKEKWFEILTKILTNLRQFKRVPGFAL